MFWNMFLVSEDIHQYCSEKSSLPSADCEAIDRYTREKVPMAQMLTGPLVGSFLGSLVGLTRAKRILEIGCFTGYSALVMAEKMPPQAELITLDTNEETTEIARRFWKQSSHGAKIKAIVGPALETLSRLPGPFDLIFIDADKENYINYLKKSLELLGPNGVIIADNCLWSGRVLDAQSTEASTQALRAFNDYVHSTNGLEATLLPIRDGLFLIRKSSSS